MIQGRLEDRKCGGASLMACDPDIYVDAYGQPKWENVMAKEYNFVMKNSVGIRLCNQRKECGENSMGL